MRKKSDVVHKTNPGQFERIHPIEVIPTAIAILLALVFSTLWLIVSSPVFDAKAITWLARSGLNYEALSAIFSIITDVVPLIIIVIIPLSNRFIRRRFQQPYSRPMRQPDSVEIDPDMTPTTKAEHRSDSPENATEHRVLISQLEKRPKDKALSPPPSPWMSLYPYLAAGAFIILAAVVYLFSQIGDALAFNNAEQTIGKIVAAEVILPNPTWTPTPTATPRPTPGVQATPQLIMTVPVGEHFSTDESIKTIDIERATNRWLTIIYTVTDESGNPVVIEAKEQVSSEAFLKAVQSGHLDIRYLSSRPNTHEFSGRIGSNPTSRAVFALIVISMISYFIYSAWKEHKNCQDLESDGKETIGYIVTGWKDAGWKLSSGHYIAVRVNMDRSDIEYLAQKVDEEFVRTHYINEEIAVRYLPGKPHICQVMWRGDSDK